MRHHVPGWSALFDLFPILIGPGMHDTIIIGRDLSSLMAAVTSIRQGRETVLILEGDPETAHQVLVAGVHNTLGRAEAASGRMRGRARAMAAAQLLGGLTKAIQKRPVSVAQLEEIVDDIESRLSEKPDREISSTEVGELVMQRLHDLDEVAYVRFASVYRQFKDVHQFVEEVKSLLGPAKRSKD